MFSNIEKVGNGCKKRDEAIDLAKGVCVLLMILGHTYVYARFSGILITLIYLIHMPVFFLINGYFFKKVQFKAHLNKDAKTILLPLFVTSIINIPFLCIINDISFEKVLKSVLLCMSMSTNDDYCQIGAVWFLGCLFFVRILMWIVLCIPNRLGQVVIVLISCVVGFIVGHYYYLPYSIDVAFVALIFSYVGYLIRNKKLLDTMLIKFNHAFIWTVFFVMYLMVCVIEYCVANEYFNFAARTYPWGLLGIAISLFFTIGVVLFCKYIGHFAFFRPIVWVGENSLLFLCVHTLDTYFINKISSDSIMNNLLVFALRVIIITMLVVIIIRIKRTIIEKQNLLSCK